jgi:hypothetical protein
VAGYDWHKAKNISATESEFIALSYRTFWDQKRTDLGHYFRLLYNIIRFIDSSCYKENKIYIRLLRAQISDYELVIIFYNTCVPMGANLRHYAEKYSLFDNLDESLLFNPDHKKLIAATAFGD